LAASPRGEQDERLDGGKELIVEGGKAFVRLVLKLPRQRVAALLASGDGSLGKLVVARVQAIDGITRTLSCPVVHL
jgi:hypothetical protein